MQQTYYTQVLTSLDKGIPPKSRESVLEGYFFKYLPSFSSLFMQSVSGFIKGQLSYEQMLALFDSAIPQQQIRQRNKVYYYLKNDRKKWGDRSMPPIPEKYERIPLREERARFMEAFGPRQEVVMSRIPGTIQRYKDRVKEFQEIGAW